MFGFRDQERSVAVASESTDAEWVLDFAPAVAIAPKPDFAVVEMTKVLPEVHEDKEPPKEPAEPQPPEETSFIVNGSVSAGLETPAEQDAGYIAKIIDTENAGMKAAGLQAPVPGTGGGSFGKGTKFGKGMGKSPFGRTPREGGRAAAMLAKMPKDQREKILKKLKDGRGLSATNFGNRKRKGQPGIRGTVYYTAANSALDARSFSITGLSFDKPSYAQNRLGVMVGGPLRIPKLIDLPRTSFTLSYNLNYNRGPFNSFGTVPSALDRAGDFSQAQVRGPVRVFDPQSGAPFPENRIPQSRFAPAASGLLRYLPLPNRPGDVQNYQYVTSADRKAADFSVRINQPLSQKNRLSGGVSWQRRENENPTLFGFLDEISGKGYTVDLGWSFTLGPKKINDFRLRVNRDRNETVPYFAYRENVAASLGIHGPSDKPVNWGPPNLSFTNFASLSDGNPILRRNQNVSLIESVSIVQKQHTIQGGIEFRWAQINTNTDQNARGAFTFSGLMTSNLVNGQPTPGTGFDFADFLLGFPQSSSIRYGATDTYFRSNVYAAWVQDEWRAKSNLTLNLGVRYEYYSPFYEKFGHLANLDVAPAFTGVAVVTPGAAGPYTGVFPGGLVDPDPNNIAPRIGFAWRPRPKSRMHVRGGYSQFYDGATYANIAVRLAAQPPFASTASTQTSLNRRLTLQDGFGSTPGKQVNNTFAVARNYRVPYAQTWNISIQQEAGRGLVFEAGYTGTKGTRLDVLRLPNRAMPGSSLTAEQRRMIGNAVGFTFDSSEGNSIYHGALFRFTRRLQKGVSFTATYQWAKSIDNASSVGGAGSVVAQNDRNLAAERGLSVFDQRHNVTISNIVNSPFGDTAFWLRDRSWASRLLKDWNLATSLTARSGTPFTARVLGNIADAGGTGAVGSGRADATGESVTSGTGFFNRAAFATPPSGRFGNAGRNTIPGPSFAVMNVSFGRTFNISDRRKLEFRIQSENATNHVNFTSIATVVNARNYGLATNAGQMRTMNMTLRYRF